MVTELGDKSWSYLQTSFHTVRVGSFRFRRSPEKSCLIQMLPRFGMNVSLYWVDNIAFQKHRFPYKHKKSAHDFRKRFFIYGVLKGRSLYPLITRNILRVIFTLIFNRIFARSALITQTTVDSIVHERHTAGFESWFPGLIPGGRWLPSLADRIRLHWYINQRPRRRLCVCLLCLQFRRRTYAFWKHDLTA